MEPVLFSRAVAVEPASGGEPGRFQVELLRAWEAEGAKQHGGVLLALAASAGLAALTQRTPSRPVRWQPLAVSAAFVRAGSTGAAELTTEVLGECTSEAPYPDADRAVVRSTLRQNGQVLLDTTLTAGLLPPRTGRPVYTGPGSLMTPEPPPELLDRTGPAGRTGPVGKTGPAGKTGPPLASACEVVIDPSTTAYRRKERTRPAMRGWVRPRGEEPDALFALFSGDILPTGLFNVGLVGWAPTVQLTALLRAVPAPGWLRVQTETRTIAGGWFDEDVTVFDSAGRLICQARQLARSPRPRTVTPT